jgi:hypothetical protein
MMQRRIEGCVGEHCPNGPSIRELFPFLEESSLIKFYCYGVDVDDTLPSNLEVDVLWRLRVLKYRPRKHCDPEDLVNLNAIVDAYNRGALKVGDHVVTVWYFGHMTVGPLKVDDPILDQV